MDIALITHLERRALGWVTDDDATRHLVDSLRRSGLAVTVHEVETAREVEALLARRRPTTLAWGNAYTLPASTGDAAGASVDLAALFERYGVPFVGSGAASLRGLLDKGWCQARLAAAGVPVPRHVVVTDATAALGAQLAAAAMAPPFFVKPTATSASVGVSAASLQDTVDGAWRQCRRLLARFGGSVLVEEFLPGRELTVGVLREGASARTLATWVDHRSDVPGHSFMTETSRRGDFAGGRTRLVPVTDPELLGRLEALAERVCAVLGIRDVTRMDCRLDAGGDVRVFDVNGMPGLMPGRGMSVEQVFSLFPETDRRAIYDAFVCTIVRAAAARAGLELPAAVRAPRLPSLRLAVA